jgi:hypothetical protein
MARWEWPGFVAIDVPDGWIVGESAGEPTIEIESPSRRGAFHISFAHRSRPDPPSVLEAIEVLANVPGAPTDVKPVTERRDDRASASTSYIKRDEAGSWHWLVGVIVWPRLAVTYSFVDDGTDAVEAATAAAMAMSIQRAEDLQHPDWSPDSGAMHA